MAEMNPEAELSRCRARIDDVDLQILELLNQRTLVVQEIGEIKQTASLPVYEPKREDLVYQNVTAHNRGPLPNDAVRRVFERIIDEMRKVQRDRMEKNA
ncbi:MAG: chorismate mutase [Bryobacterales bacterium]|jgi:chorismate mutase|nr:chorismate mutase [Bryobacterales bacterium]